jgi:tryptophan synthase alpha chain
MNLNNPQIVGFGINNHDTFAQATTYAKGAIIGSAFIKALTENRIESINTFIDKVSGKF